PAGAPDSVQRATNAYFQGVGIGFAFDGAAYREPPEPVPQRRRVVIGDDGAAISQTNGGELACTFHDRISAIAVYREKRPEHNSDEGRQGGVANRIARARDRGDVSTEHHPRPGAVAARPFDF